MCQSGCGLLSVCVCVSGSECECEFKCECVCRCECLWLQVCIRGYVCKCEWVGVEFRCECDSCVGWNRVPPFQLCNLCMVDISHNTNSSIQAGVATTVIDVCLAVGPSVASCTPACEGARDNAILGVCV